MKAYIRSIRIFVILLVVSVQPGAAGVLGMASQVNSASLTVNSTSDAWDVNPGDGVCEATNGHCTLRAAIMETNALAGADVIILPAGNFQMTIAGTMEDDSVTGDLDIRGSLTISGTGKASTIIDMNHLDRVIDIKGTGLTIQLSDLTLQNGFNEDKVNWDRGGAGIFVPAGSNLVLDQIEIYNNRESYLSRSPFGGAIYSRGELTLDKTDVISNTAGQGGGITSLGKLTMTDGNIDENTGGGIWIGGEASLDSVSITGNSYSSGGGISNGGIMTITGSTISGNTAGSGGGIWSNGVLTMIDSLVTENVATVGIAGGIANTYSDGKLTLIHSIVSNNTAQIAGGGIESSSSQGPLTILNSQIISNKALNGDGGGIYGAPDLMIDSTVMGNQSWGGNGAGVYQSGYSWRVSTYANTTVNNNIAWNGNGGGIYNLTNTKVNNSTISGNQAAQHGGGIFNKSMISLNNATVTENVADSDVDNTGNAGGIYNDSGTVTLQDSILAENKDNSSLIVYPDCDGTFTSQGYNLIQTVSSMCILEGNLTGNLTGNSPGLGPLQNNGGATYTRLPQIGSPVLDAGNPAGCKDGDGNLLGSDQRGVYRPLDGNDDGVSVCDMGAVEIGVMTNLEPGETQTLVYTDTQSNITTIQIPGGAITEAVELAFSPIVTVAPLENFTFVRHAFELSAYQDGELLPRYLFQTPVTITVQYTPADVGWADEQQLKLMLFGEAGWSDAALTCNPPSEYTHDSQNHTISLQICHLSLFGVFGPTRPAVHTFIPLIKK